MFTNSQTVAPVIVTHGEHGNLGNDYMYNSMSPETTEKVAKVLLNNVSNDMINNFRNYAEDDFLKSLLPQTKKLKI